MSPSPPPGPGERTPAQGLRLPAQLGAMVVLPFLRRHALPVVALTLLAACGSAEAAPKRSVATPSTVAGVGVLPADVATSPPATIAVTSSTARPATTATTVTPTTTAATTAPASTVAETVPVSATTVAEAAASNALTAAPSEPPAGQRATGNRILMIGDSVLAGTSARYSNDMCEALVPLGWQVELDAEVGRFIDFGDRVLDKRLSAGWDAALIFLGSNYGDNQPIYANMLEEQVDRLGSRPVVLVTVTEFKPDRAEVNAAIKMIAFNHPNVSIVDWAAISEANPSVLSGDGLHPTPSGRQVLATSVASVLGDAPAQPGTCLKTNFRDDSAGSVVTGTTKPVSPPTTRRRVTTTTTKTTTKPTTGPTTKPTTPTATTTPKTSPGTTADVPKTTADTPKTTDAPKTTPAATPAPTPKPTSPPVTTAGP